MSDYQGFNTNALLDPIRAINATGTFSEPFAKKIYTAFSDLIYPSKMEEYTIVGEDGKEEIITMPGKTRFTNWSCSSKYLQHIFPYIYYNECDKTAFYIGADAVQVTNHEDFYVFSYYENDNTFFNIILIREGKIYLIELNDKDGVETYYELTPEIIDEVKYFLDGQEYLIEPGSYESLLELFTNVKVEGISTEKIDISNIENKVRELLNSFINSPEKVTNKSKKPSQSLFYCNSWPRLELNHRASDILEKKEKARSMVVDIPDGCRPGRVSRYYCKRNNNDEIEELYFYVFGSDIYCYVTSDERPDKNGISKSYLVKCYYDTATAVAFEKLCGGHLMYDAFLTLKDATDAGLDPWSITFEEVGNPQEQMQRILDNPDCITETNEYQKTLKRPCPGPFIENNNL